MTFQWFQSAPGRLRWWRNPRPPLGSRSPGSSRKPSSSTCVCMSVHFKYRHCFHLLLIQLIHFDIAAGTSVGALLATVAQLQLHLVMLALGQLDETVVACNTSSRFRSPCTCRKTCSAWLRPPRRLRSARAQFRYRRRARPPARGRARAARPACTSRASPAL